MKLGLSRRHIVESEYGRSLASHDVLRGWIEWDEEAQRELPLLVVDGRPLSWNELGRILTAYEGFQIKLEIREKTAD